MELQTTPGDIRGLQIIGERIFRLPHFSSLSIRSKYTSNMAAWFYAQFNGVTAHHVYARRHSALFSQRNTLSWPHSDRPRLPGPDLVFRQGVLCVCWGRGGGGGDEALFLLLRSAGAGRIKRRGEAAATLNQVFTATAPAAYSNGRCPALPN